MQIIQHRWALHQIPELDRDLPETLAYLRKVLTPLGCTLSSPIPGALCAFFRLRSGRRHRLPQRRRRPAHPGEHRPALRLPPPREDARLRPRRPHGHGPGPGPVAGGADRPASQHPPPLPAGGGDHRRAKDLCQSGVFEAHHVRCVFGMHLWPDLPAGVIASRKKELMSRSCEVSVTVTGKSSHIAKAEEGRDALAAGVEFYHAGRWPWSSPCRQRSSGC